MLDRQSGWKDVAQARRVLELADGRRETPFESWSAWAFAVLGVPQPAWQVTITDAAGAFLGRVDGWWPEGVAGEADGDLKYRLAAAERGGATADNLAAVVTTSGDVSAGCGMPASSSSAGRRQTSSTHAAPPPRGHPRRGTGTGGPEPFHRARPCPLSRGTREPPRRGCVTPRRGAPAARNHAAGSARPPGRQAAGNTAGTPRGGEHRRDRVGWIDVAVDFPAQIRELRTTLESILEVSDLPGLRKQVAELSEQASAPDLWDDPERAQAVTSKLSHVQSELDRLGRAQGRLDDLEVLVELAESEDDAETLAEAERELVALTKSLGELEVRTLLSGEYDGREALITIRSEAGGVDAADFAEMLLRMYLRWAERHGYKTEVYDTSYAEEAGIKSATFKVDAPYAYGTLSVEQGTHRLVRISPFDNQGRRQTSFAGVEVLPVVAETDHIDIPENDIRVDVYRSSGPGGQSVNTTDSAVRLTHLPTGIVVTCQNEKSQLQNKAAAMRVLQAKLLERARSERQAELDALKGDGGSSWGNQMRSYVLHPYQMVKDLRTEYETGNPSAVFDGEIDEFLETGIRWRRGADKVGA